MAAAYPQAMSTQVQTPEPRRPAAGLLEVCDVCGNRYDKTFEVKYGGRSYTFDCLECAIHQLAPQCAHCRCRVIGHGVEADGAFYCCAHCARAHGQTEARDRVEHG
jgi:hypothetical protein